MRFLISVSLLLLAVPCFGARVSTSMQVRVLPFEARGDRYVARGPGFALSVTPRGAALQLRGQTFQMSIVGASPSAAFEPLERMPGKANYILGRDVRASYDLFGRVRRQGVYPGIDLVCRANQERLEYDFELAPGRDPRKIQLAFDGIDRANIDARGNLVLRSGALAIMQPKPFAYQIIAGYQWRD